MKILNGIGLYINFNKSFALIALVFFIFNGGQTFSQEDSLESGQSASYHNQLLYNRFLINPTFSLVKENKSYLNILHRNQYTSFDDNLQNYYIGYSNKLDDKNAIGIGVYTFWSGIVQEFGFNANYANSVNLGSDNSLSFGTNITYLSKGVDKNRVYALENDPLLENINRQSKIKIQPGLNLSLGRFDFGMYAKNLIQYNQTNNTLLTGFDIHNISGTIQYSHIFKAENGLFANARLLSLVQFGLQETNSLAFSTSLLLDLPQYGWVQTVLDNEYGLSLGLGININKKLSLGYLYEKNILDYGADLGWNHELSLAYKFKNDMEGIAVDNVVSQDSKIDQIVKNYEEQILQLTSDSDYAGIKGKSLAEENRLILNELILRQDSLESVRSIEYEKRFEMIVNILKDEINKSKVDIPDVVKNNTCSVGHKGIGKNYKINNPKVKVKKNNNSLSIKKQGRSKIIGADSGYYLIANVFKNEENLMKFMSSLVERGLFAQKFYNKENDLHYVYIANFKAKEQAHLALRSNLNGKYRSDKWIMEVVNTNGTANNLYEE